MSGPSLVKELRETFHRRRYGGDGAYEPDFDLLDVAADRIAELEAERDAAVVRAASIEANGLSNCCREDGIEPCEPYKALEVERDALRKALERITDGGVLWIEGLAADDLRLDIVSFRAGALTVGDFRRRPFPPVRGRRGVSERYVSPHRLPTPRERELLTILIEEAAEVQKNTTKLLRFGARDIDPNAGDLVCNDARLGLEVGDVMAMVDLCIDAGLINPADIDAGRKAKRIKVERFLQTDPDTVAAPPPSGEGR